MNSLFIIFPYKLGTTWVFDDAARGLKQEPFVGDVNKIIDLEVGEATKISVTFSDMNFPGANFELVKTDKQESLGGTWYLSPKYLIEGWLCPALLKFFSTPPPKIFIKTETLS